MAPKKSLVLIGATGAELRAEIAVPLQKAGWVVHSATLGDSAKYSAPIAVLAVEQPVELWGSLTHRLRAESHPKVLWLLDSETLGSATYGLENGADVCLVRPADPELLVAQLDSLWRSRIERDRFAQLDSPSADMAGRLQKVYGQIESEANFARGLLEEISFTATVPSPSTPIQILGFRSGSGVRGATAFELVRAPVVGFSLADCTGLGVTACIATALTALKQLTQCDNAPRSALEQLGRVFESQPLPESALLSAGCGMFSDDMKSFHFSLAGIPGPVFLPAIGPARVLTGSGPFLGSPGVSYSESSVEMNPGDRLIFFAGSFVAESRPDIRNAAEGCRASRSGQFAEAIADHLGADGDSGAGFCLIVVERMKNDGIEMEDSGIAPM